MSVEINIPPVLQAIIGGARQIDVAGGTVGECLEALSRKYPALRPRLFNRRGKPPSGMSIYVNGESAYPDPLARPVREGDKIHLAYIVLGG
jgi:molybdopterin converting factor small subunit